MKKVHNVSGKTTLTTQDQAFCFNFVYPITLEYNNGTQVIVSNFEGLLEVLVSESNTFYIDGIVFPFQVQQEGTITTIDDEAEFFALIQECGNIQIVNDFVFDFTCYDIVFPISIINANGHTVAVNSQAELLQLVSNPAANSTYHLNIVFPISVVQENQTIVINSLYDLFDLNNDCAASSCVCPTVYDPVCVQTPTGIVEYSNACFAECDGFTPNDFVSCDPNNPCLCPTDFNPVCVQTTAGVVQYDNACRAECDGFTPADFITCGVNPNQTFGQLLGSCFTVSYPVHVQFQGALVTIHNDSELLQYWFPAHSAYPAFHYPITVTFSGSNISTTIASQSAFQLLVAQHCN
jgi:hypothetical protein